MVVRPVLLIAALIAIATMAAAQAPDSLMRGQGDATLEIAPKANRQQASPPPAIVPPSESVLVIPEASRNFVGRWGGRLMLERSTGPLDPPPDAIVSLGFGERAGEVFVRTTVFAAGSANVTKTDAEVISPTEVTLVVSGIDMYGDEPIRHIEAIELELAENQRVDCFKNVELYHPGDDEPFAEAQYHGTLGLLDSATEQSIEREVSQEGEVPKASIDATRPITPAP